jgi:hypothetical protein
VRTWIPRRSAFKNPKRGSILALHYSDKQVSVLLFLFWSLRWSPNF